MKGLDHVVNLTSLDLSFNDIKHIKNISTLVHLKDLYFIQNRIQTIEGLEELKELRNLELGANKIRVWPSDYHPRSIQANSKYGGLCLAEN